MHTYQLIMAHCPCVSHLQEMPTWMKKEIEKLRAAWKSGNIPGAPRRPVEDPDSEDAAGEDSDDAEEPERTGTLTEAAKNNRLRRLCEKKPSGRCHVPEEIQARWSKGGSERLALRDELEQCGWDKDYLKGICMHRYTSSQHLIVNACMGNMCPCHPTYLKHSK